MKPQFSSPRFPLNTRIFSLSESYCSFQSELLVPNRPMHLPKFRGRFGTLSPPDEFLILVFDEAVALEAGAPTLVSL